MNDRALMVNGDGLEVLRALRGEVDAIVTDPPYCSGGVTEAGRARATAQGVRSEVTRRKYFNWFKADDMTTAGLVWMLRSVAFEAAERLVDGGSLCVFCDWRMAPILIPALESGGLRYQNLIVWDKGAVGLGRGFRMQHELLLVHLTKGVGCYSDVSTGNVIHAPRIGEDREHPTQKPVALLRRVIRVVAPPDGLIFDPFAGSGSTGVAAVAEGRRFLGVERSREYAAVASRRISEAMGQAAPAASQLGLDLKVGR